MKRCLLAAGIVALAVLLNAASGRAQLPSFQRTLATPSFWISVGAPLARAAPERPFPIDVGLAPRRPGAADTSLAIVARPSFDVGAEPVRAEVRGLWPHHYAAALAFPSRGHWELEFSVTAGDGPPETAFIPFEVVAPNAMPPWEAWSIGFSPLVALGLFGLSERRRLLAEPCV